MPLLRLGSTTDRVVAGAALLAFALRFPGAFWPVRADEAGFTLVARAWEPQADSVFGTYFVDRPPLLIAIVKLFDEISSPYGLRLLAAVGCAVAVFSAAGVARLIATERAAAWTAVATAAIVGNTMIDSVAAKGEILGVPVILTGFWWSLLALERRSVGWAFGAGFLATFVLGLKQSLVGALVFGAVLLLFALLTRRLSGSEFGRLGGAALAGASVPVLGTVAWSLSAGVRLETLWYTVFGFRGDATQVLVSGVASASQARAADLVTIVLTGGIALIIGGFLVHLRDEWRANAPVAAATLAVVAVDSTGLVLSGSFWRPYAFALVPACALCAALLVRRRSKRGHAMRAMIVIAVVSSTVNLVSWTSQTLQGASPPTEFYTGEAVGQAADEDDTLVVFGGRADIQFAAGLRSPYEHLWSLPMRTLDPEYVELRDLVNSRDRPTWIVEWVPFDAWEDDAGERLRGDVEEHYAVNGFGCHGRPVWVRADVQRPFVTVDCDRRPF